MHIPAQCILPEMPSPSNPFRVLANNVTPMVYDLEPRDEFKALSAAVVVAIVWLVLLAVIVRFSSNDNGSDSNSSISESSWSVEGPGSLSSEITARRQKRLKKLDEAAPSQSLQDWRTAKMTTCARDFATVSNKLI